MTSWDQLLARKTSCTHTHTPFVWHPEHPRAEAMRDPVGLQLVCATSWSALHVRLPNRGAAPLVLFIWTCPRDFLLDTLGLGSSRLNPGEGAPVAYCEKYSETTSASAGKALCTQLLRLRAWSLPPSSSSFFPSLILSPPSLTSQSLRLSLSFTFLPSWAFTGFLSPPGENCLFSEKRGEERRKLEYDLCGKLRVLKIQQLSWIRIILPSLSERGSVKSDMISPLQETLTLTWFLHMEQKLSNNPTHFQVSA